MHHTGWAAAAALVLQAGCADQGPSEAFERLDQDTGVTLTRMGDALEFYVAEPGAGATASSFAFLGAIEVNRMGERRLLLWISTIASGEDAAAAEASAGRPPAPRVRVLTDSEEFEPRLVAATYQELGLSQSPYRSRAGWARDGYFDVTLEQLRRMRDAERLALTVDDAAGNPVRFDVWKAERGDLARFIDKIDST
jgi:hypothetical protein